MAQNPYNSMGTFNYYNPGSIYGSTQYTSPGQFGTTPLGNTYLEANRDASFTRYLAGEGFRDNIPLGDYARAQRAKAFEGYGAALGTNPNLKFQDYLRTNNFGQRVREDFLRLTPGQRGESVSQFAPRARQSRWQ